MIPVPKNANCTNDIAGGDAPPFILQSVDRVLFPIPELQNLGEFGAAGTDAMW